MRKSIFIGATAVLFLLATSVVVAQHDLGRRTALNPAPPQLLTTFTSALVRPEVIVPIDDHLAHSSGVQPGYRASLYNTAWPADMADLNRSNSVNNAGLPRNVTAADLAIDTVAMPFPVFAYTRNADEVFVLGGTPFSLDSYVSSIDGLPKGSTVAQPHITKYNPSTGQQVRLSLNLGTTVPYVGGALIHANGFVYVISQSYIYKISPESMTISKSAPLPVLASPNSESTVYNGLTTSQSGNILTKYFSINGDAPSKFLVIDAETLAIKSSTEYSGSTPRLAVAKLNDGREHLYHLNADITFRFLINESLTVDEAWMSRFSAYQSPLANNAEPTSPVIVNGRAHYTTNTFPSATRPMRIFWQDIESNYSVTNPPLGGVDLFNAIGPGWSFFHLSIDEATGIIIGNDQGHGLLAAVRIEKDNTVTRLWQKSLRVSARPAIVSDRQMVYATDYKNGKNNLVALDLVTGVERFRVETPATRATISTIVVSTNNEVYFGSNEPGKSTGLFHRIYVRAR
jgi:hypothetical protein